MTFTNGGGFVQKSPSVITADVFESNNFSNTNQTGFDLNGESTTDTAGTPANTIQIYTGFNVGPPAGDHIALTYTGGQAQVELFTGLAGETTSASVFAEPYTAVPTVPAIVVESAAMANGFTQLILIPSDNAAGGINDVGRAVLNTVGTTVPPSGGNLLKGVFNIGSTPTDTWAVVINSENPVANAQPALVIGDTFTPRSRLFVSPSEILSVDGTGATETLWLNETNTEASPGGVANKRMRSVGTASGAAGQVNIAATAYAALPGVQATSQAVICPPSGTLQVTIAVQISAVAATVQGDFAGICVNVVNTTQSSTPFAAVDGRASFWTATGAGIAAGGNLTLTRGYTLTGLGNAGDSLTVAIFARVGTTNRFAALRTELSVTPSL